MDVIFTGYSRLDIVIYFLGGLPAPIWISHQVQVISDSVLAPSGVSKGSGSKSSLLIRISWEFSYPVCCIVTQCSARDLMFSLALYLRESEDTSGIVPCSSFSGAVGFVRFPSKANSKQDKNTSFLLL